MVENPHNYYNQLKKARERFRKRQESLVPETIKEAPEEVSPMVPDAVRNKLQEKSQQGTQPTQKQKSIYARQQESLENLSMVVEEMNKMKQEKQKKFAEGSREANIVGTAKKFADEYLGPDERAQLANFSTYKPARVPVDVEKDTAFMKKVSAVSRNLGIKSEDLMAVMAFETGGTFNPAERNKAGSSGTGLIQFMAPTARSLGTTTEELAQMSRVEQMDYVEKYLSQFDVEGANRQDLYMAVLYPKAIKKDEDYVLFAKGTKAYSQNRGLDRDKDGKVTKREAASKV